MAAAFSRSLNNRRSRRSSISDWVGNYVSVDSPACRELDIRIQREGPCSTGLLAETRCPARLVRLHKVPNREGTDCCRCGQARRREPKAKACRPVLADG